MPVKKVVQDIIPSERSSIRKITIKQNDDEPLVKTNRRKIARHGGDEESEKEDNAEQIQTKRTTKSRKTARGSFKYFIGFIFILGAIIVIGVALSLSYSKAIVTITPKVSNSIINGTFTAKKSMATTSSDDLAYDMITVSNSLNQNIPATKGPPIQTKAKGVVVLYNNYSTTSQTLVAGTRLTGPNGLIYKTTSTTSIPGKKPVPAGTTVNIIADQAGENYNLKATDAKENFTLPGFKGTPKYAGFYGRLKMDLTGGFSGNRISIDTDVEKATIVALEANLKSQLITKLQKNVPKDFTLYNKAYNIEYETPEPIMKNNNSADIEVRGVAYGAVFNTNLLIKSVASKEIQKFPSDTYTISGDKDLSFKVLNEKDFSAKKGTPLIFNLQGPIVITGTFSESKLKNELTGMKLKDSDPIFAKYSSITNAYTLITPFWLRSFPSSPDKIIFEYKH